MGRFLGITVKRGIPCRCLGGHVKEPYEMCMAWESDRRFNFFFNPPAHLCAIKYMTEISLNVTLNNHIHPLTHSRYLGLYSVGIRKSCFGVFDCLCITLLVKDQERLLTWNFSLGCVQGKCMAKT